MGLFFRVLWWIDHQTSKGLHFSEYESHGCYYLGNVIMVFGSLLLLPLCITDIFATHEVRAIWKADWKREQKQLKELIRKGEDKIRW